MSHSTISEKNCRPLADTSFFVGVKGPGPILLAMVLVLLLVLFFISGEARAAFFDKPEKTVQPSPGTPRELELPDIQKVLDFNISPFGPEAAVLTLNPK
jgi:hypothetical protein